MTNSVIEFVKSYLQRNLHLACGIEANDIDDFNEEFLVFVSLESNGFVRGVGGSFERKEPLYKALERESFAAAFSDDRFSPLRPDEFNNLKICVTFLNPDEIMNSVVIES